MTTVAAEVARMFPETSRRYARCLKKLGYPSVDAAEQVRARRQAQVAEVLRVYACTDCGFWHLTHRPLTAAQVEAERLFLQADIHAMEAALVRARTLSRPYGKGHAMRKRSLAQMDADFAEQRTALQHLQDLWMAGFQRHTALVRADAAGDARALRQVEREALQTLAVQQRMFQRDWDAWRAQYARYRSEFQRTINLAYPLPRYEWRRGAA